MIKENHIHDCKFAKFHFNYHADVLKQQEYSD